MKIRLIPSLIVAIACTLVLTTLDFTPVNAQSLVYNHASRKWEKPNPRRLYQRTPPAKYRRQVVAYSTSEAPGTIIVDTRRKFLYLVQENRRAIRYGIGVGREGFGWEGEVKVKRKAEWPSWHPPAEMIKREWEQNKRRLPTMQKGGPKNPLGARALYLYEGNRDTLYRIHGTNEPWSIGLNVSSGCIRLLNDDVKDLYSRVKVGAKVVVKQSSGGLASIFGG